MFLEQTSQPVAGGFAGLRKSVGFLPDFECGFAVQPIRAICASARGTEWMELLMRPRGRFEHLAADQLARILYRQMGFSATDRAIISLGLCWLSSLDVPVKLSINVHPQTLVEPDFADWLGERIDGYGLPTSSLSLEIIEFAETINLGKHCRELQTLRRMGVSLALDDYGNGSSNLALMAEECIDVVKLDRSIVRMVPVNERYAALTARIREMVNELGASMVAEGVEYGSDLEALRTLGVHWGQGFFFARPKLIDI